MELGTFKYGLLYYVDLILSKVKVVIFMSHATATARVILWQVLCIVILGSHTYTEMTAYHQMSNLLTHKDILFCQA